MIRDNIGHRFFDDSGVLNVSRVDLKQAAAFVRLLARQGYGIRRALVLSTGNTDRVSPIDYLPVYMVMFLDHDGLPSNLTFPKPSLDLSVSPHFKSR